MMENEDARNNLTANYIWAIVEVTELGFMKVVYRCWQCFGFWFFPDLDQTFFPESGSAKNLNPIRKILIHEKNI